MNDTSVARKPRVFCVDDDSALADWMDLALSDQGWDIQTETDPLKALERIAARPPDVILLDVTMPGLDGYQICERLQKAPDTAYIPVIFVTGLAGERDRAKAFLVGGVDYLVKPVTEEALKKAVAHHIATRGKFSEIRQIAQRPAVAPRATPVQRWDSAFLPSGFTRFKEALAGRLRLSPDKTKALVRLTPDALYAGAAELGLSGRQVAESLAAYLNAPFLPRIDPQQVRLGVLPTPFCLSNQVLALGDLDGGLSFALTNPFRWDVLEVLRRAAGSEKIPRLAFAEPDAFKVFAGRSAPAAAPADSIDQIHAELRRELATSSASLSTYAVEAQDHGPLVELVNRLIEAAYDAGASDIHIEPAENEVVVRYRIDGDLTTANRFQPAELHKRMIARLKVMSGLDIAEHRLPQDGRIAFKGYTQRRDLDVDLRVAILPVQHGEKACLRLLDKQKAVLPLEKLGFSPRNLALYREKIRTPYGMILHTGPTGSGKSMSLYAALNEVKSATTNIQTAEDPIEYTLPGINQLQVSPDIGLTFSRALRSFLRVDPDILLIGETRDAETAKISVEAALTGHLLFSTMHTNDAASTFTRFIEMGIEPYLISSSLTLVCAQRLIRRLCPECRQGYAPDEAERRLVGARPDEALTLYRAQGCASCGGLGYKGRIAIHELLAPNAAFRAAILKKGVSAEELKRVAVRECGMTSLYWDAMEKVRQGICSVEDALQNVRRDEDDAVPPSA